MDRPEDGPLRFLVASRWNAWKGHRTLLEAWDTDVFAGVLVIAGSAPTVGEGVDVPRIVAGLKRPESVEIVGQIDSIFDVLDDVDALIVPSDKPEPFGLVAIEAFSRGRAVIGSAAGGLLEIVDDGVAGRLSTWRRTNCATACRPWIGRRADTWVLPVSRSFASFTRQRRTKAA